MTQPKIKIKADRRRVLPGMRRENVPVRLPEWIVEWMVGQWMEDPDKTATALIESAMIKAHKLRPPRAP